MEAFGFAALFGLILGFMFGVGCASAVLYTIFMGGYKSALRDGLTGEHPPRYSNNLEKVRTKLEKERGTAAHLQ